jgi:hypothetical protein
MQSLIILLFLSLNSYAQGVPAPMPSDSDLAIQFVAQSLRFGTLSTVQVLDVQIEFSGSREYHQMTFSSLGSGDVQILISGPKGFQNSPKPYQTLFLAGGFMTGQGTVDLVGDPGETILVGYQYPFSKEQIQADPSLLYKSIHLVPGQIALALSWLSKQSFVNPQNFHVMGVSLGSLLLPVALRLDQIQKVVPTSTLLCFGGSEFGLVFDHVLKNVISDSFVRGALVNGLANLLAPYNPKLHLPYLQGRFFTLFAEQDQIFPTGSSLEQYNLLPEPKEIHWISGPHIDVDQPEQIQKTMAEVNTFLRKVH